MVPHADETFAGVAGVAEVEGFGGVFVERSGEVAGIRPVAAAAGRGDRGDGFEIGEPDAAPFVAGENPDKLLVVGGEGFEGDLAGESGIRGEASDGGREVRREIGIDGDELRGVFGLRGGLPVAKSGTLVDFAVEVTTHLTLVESGTVILESVVFGGGAGEEEVGIKGGNLVETSSFDKGSEVLLEEDGKGSRSGAVAIGDLTHAVTAGTANDIGSEVPETGLRVKIVTTEMDAVGSFDVAENGAAAVTELERGREGNAKSVESGLAGGDEATIGKAGGIKAVVGAVLAPGVAGDDSATEELVAAFGGNGGEGSDGRLLRSFLRVLSGWFLREDAGFFGDDGGELEVFGGFGGLEIGRFDFGRLGGVGSVGVFDGISVGASVGEALIFSKAFAVKGALEGVHGFVIRSKLVGSSLGADAVNELLAELGEADGGAIVGLAFRGLVEEVGKVGLVDGLPVGGVVAGGDGEDLFLTRRAGNLKEELASIGGIERKGELQELLFEIFALVFDSCVRKTVLIFSILLTRLVVMPTL